MISQNSYLETTALLRAVAVSLSLAMAAAGCGGGGGGGSPAPAPQPPPPSGDAPTAVATSRVFPALSFDQPLALVRHDNRWYVAERAGRILRFSAGDGSAQVALDISDRVASNASENGLLGFVFHPEAAANGAMYVSYTTGNPMESHLSYFAFDAATGTMDPASEQRLLSVRQPESNHNGGHLLFEPGTMNLYWGLGDGGGAGDPNSNGQNPRSLLGTVVRVDLTTPNAIAIPAGNPFADEVDGAPEVYLYGLRNPWRFDEDPVTGNLYIGDVGQDSVEEINLGVAGGNYGWSCFEGSQTFSDAASCPDRDSTETPIASLGHPDAQSVTGGLVYSGAAIPGLVGKFVFGDFISGSLWSLEATGTGFARELIAETGLGIVSFGADETGELYIVDYFTGEIHQVVPAP